MPISHQWRRRGLLSAGLTMPFLLRTRRAEAADPAAHPWIVPDLLAPAQKEGGLTIYSSTNEQEGLPLWQIFENATGIKITYVRAADAALIGRIGIEARTGQQSWDLLNTTTVNQTPAQFLATFDPPEAAAIIADARDPAKRWYGCYGNYNAPAYNTRLVARQDLPTSFEGFLDHPEWAGKIAIEPTDKEWLYAIEQTHGEAAGRKLVQDIIAKLRPVVVDGHLALARALSAGEYTVALNNYVMLTDNMSMAGGPTDFWPLDPVALFFGALGVNIHAPHPNAARLGANFMLSQEAQAFAAKTGRLPTRPDVASEPAGVIARLSKAHIVPVNLSTEEARRWQKSFRDLLQAQ